MTQRWFSLPEPKGEPIYATDPAVEKDRPNRSLIAPCLYDHKEADLYSPRRYD